jgi:hypothetical protein
MLGGMQLRGGNFLRRLRFAVACRSASIEVISGNRGPERSAYVQYGDRFDRKHCFVYYFAKDATNGWRFESARDYSR